MAQHVENTSRFNVPANKVWNALNDFGAVANFAPAIETSPLTNGQNSGIGAKRSCNFYDGTKIVEEIIELKEGESVTVVLTDHTMPLNSAIATMKVVPVTANSCDITISMDFVVKGGPFGWLLGFVMMAPFMKSVFKKTSQGLAYYSATGKAVGKELPTKEELASVVPA
ncbi:MAG: SRPBCC family protein [Bermanella sp.]